jgi:hypothetical protein
LINNAVLLDALNLPANRWRPAKSAPQPVNKFVLPLQPLVAMDPGSSKTNSFVPTETQYWFDSGAS